MRNIDNLIEKKRKAMYESINKNGISDHKTIKISQELDELIILKLKKAA